jgi:hypothetical protein
MLRIRKRNQTEIRLFWDHYLKTIQLVRRGLIDFLHLSVLKHFEPDNIRVLGSWPYSTTVRKSTLQHCFEIKIAFFIGMAERQIEDLINELRTLKLRVETLEAENNNRNVRPESNDYTQSKYVERVNGIGTGDRVRITNRVKKPADWTRAWDERKERVATVTRVTPSQIHFTTDNGVNTWRAPNNVKKITTTTT